jgi:hypothetical protein
MAALTFTATDVRAPYPNSHTTVQRAYTALEAINVGQSFYIDPTTGKAGLCDANASGKEQFGGIALESVGIGGTFLGHVRGELAGYDLSGINYAGFVYQGDTAGELADAASGTKTIRVGRVVPINSTPISKTLYVEASWLTNW